ncbi:MAG: WXG100 family type VII secretion target [Phycisphaerales bacterium]|nr:WXG100 family type VII secretion target [Phycisphaerales bacterium]
MSKAIVDPAELRRFAQDLRRFTQSLDGQMQVLNSRLSGLSQTWRDQEHMKFAQEFEQTMRVLARFNAAAAEHVPVLIKKAEKIEEYLNQR